MRLRCGALTEVCGFCIIPNDFYADFCIFFLCRFNKMKQIFDFDLTNIRFMVIIKSREFDRAPTDHRKYCLREMITKSHKHRTRS